MCPGGSSLEMLLASVASARTSHQSRKFFKQVQAWRLCAFLKAITVTDFFNIMFQLSTTLWE
jgi:hypothetical protein